MEKTKILVIIAGFNFGVSGGVASVLYNYSKYINHDKIHMDYLALGYQGFEPYREELESYGSRLYCLNIREHGWKRFVKSVRGIHNFLIENDYDVVHCNSGSMRQVLMMAMGAKGPKRKVIAHSHSAMKLSTTRTKLYGWLSNLFYIYADQYVACSEIAAKSVFPKKVVLDDKWTYLPNSIELERFVFSERKRSDVRKQLGISDSTYVVGHVGRINYAKNHKFLLDVFYEYQQLSPDSLLLIVGDGDLREELEKKASKLGIREKVIFTGQRRDANDLMQAMDIFVFPSLYEGLGMSIIESQAIGLLTLASDTVPIRETKVTDLIDYLPLGDAKEWAEKMKQLLNGAVRSDHTSEVEKAGFGIRKSVSILERIYTESGK